MDKIIILDDNEYSIIKYAEEYPENWNAICKELEKRKKENSNDWNNIINN